MSRWLRNILLVIFLGIFLVSGYLLVDYFLESRTQQAQFDDLAALMEQATASTQAPEEAAPVSPDAPTAPSEPAQPALVPVTDPKTGETIEILPEFVPLYEINSDIVGWITIDGTKVNYPVMQTPNSTDYYLKRDFEMNYSAHGCIYAREVCDVFAPSDNITIYGHRMKDGTMFSDLAKYTKKSFWEEQPYITFNTLKEHHTYQIAFVFTIASNMDTPFQYHQFVDAADQTHFDAFVENCRAYAIYDTGVDVDYGDKLITLSTCEYSQVNGRLVVVAKRVSNTDETGKTP